MDKKIKNSNYSSEVIDDILHQHVINAIFLNGGSLICLRYTFRIRAID